MSERTGERVAREQIGTLSMGTTMLKNRQPVVFKRDLKSWHSFCYLSGTTKTTNVQHTNKNNTYGSDITRTTRTEAQLTDFFGVDSFTGLAGTGARNRTENNKTASRQLPDRLDHDVVQTRD
ncbi:hypothetical protein TRP66_14970 [Pseudomonas sp. JDS28PS106]|uniref:hypothetical protein n=1 Tax=Pseudomonas sp. JDS28PS106 TaxID=2497235 RepID=UPI002FD3991C